MSIGQNPINDLCNQLNLNLTMKYNAAQQILHQQQELEK